MEHCPERENTRLPAASMHSCDEEGGVICMSAPYRGKAAVGKGGLDAPPHVHGNVSITVTVARGMFRP